MAIASTVKSFRYSYITWKVFLIVSASISILPILVLFSNIHEFDIPLFSFLMETLIPRYVKNTLFVVCVVTFLSVLLGTGLAWISAVYTFPLRRILIFLQILPLLMPAYISAIVWKNGFSYEGFMYKLFGSGVSSLPSSFILIFVLVFNLYPFVFAIMYVFFTTISQSHFDIARNMNHNGRSLFLHLGISIAHIPLLGVMLLIVMEVMNESWIYIYLGYEFLTTGIVRIWQSYGNMSIARILTAAVVIIMALLVIFKTFLEKRQHKFHPIRGNTVRPIPLKKSYEIWVLVCAIIPLFIGFIIPFVQLWVWAIPTFISGNIPSNLLQTFINSVLLACIVVGIQIPLAILLSYSYRLCKNGILKISFSFLTLGFAIPSIMVAVLVLSVVKLLDTLFPSISFFSLFINGSIIGLVMGSIYRYVPVALNSINTGIHHTNTHYEEVSRSLGCSPLKTLLKVCLPVNKGYIISACMITIIEVMRDVPMVRLLHPYNFSTLALDMFYLVNNESLDQASVVGLTLVIAGMLIIFPIHMGIMKREESFGQ